MTLTNIFRAANLHISFAGLACILLLVFSSAPASSQSYSIVYLNSYHPGYQWSDDSFNVFKKSLKTPAEIHLMYMDTKRNRGKDYQADITKKTLVFIEQHQPDLIIAADDNASGFIIEPYFKDHDIPVIFIGVNNDASTYGYPYKNATGMVEMDGTLNLVKAIRMFHHATASVGMVFGITNTSKQVINYIKKQIPDAAKIHQVDNANEWYKTMTILNDTVDLIALNTITGIEGLDHDSALAFIRENITIPILSASSASKQLAHIGYISLPEEHGNWAASTADDILLGKSPATIPIQTSSHYLMFFNESLIKATKPLLSKRLYQIPHTTLELLDKN
jgi:ABC-type uncharacterized transport system substrate-binding protein